MEVDLRAHLLADGAVAALVGVRVDWSTRPQADDYPAVVLQVVADPRDQHMKAFQELRGTRVQIDCLSRSAPQKVALREAVIAAIAGPFTQGGTAFGRVAGLAVRDLGEDGDDGFIHRDSIDATIWHKPV